VIEVMVVDDDFMVARIHTGFVERTPGFTVTGVAHTGADALAEAERLQPDLVLLDVYLPDVSGLDLISGLRDAAPEVDVLVISAAREADTVRRALRGGIVHYLMKPFSYDDLRVRLEHYQQAYAGIAGEQADQADVDRLFGVAGADKPLPKGFSAETLKLVEDTLRQVPGDARDLSAAEAAHLLGISRVSARRYLEHLNETGKAEVTLRYGEVGRPERRYAWR
jgi:response regulator of citrate/malate metabolism